MKIIKQIGLFLSSFVPLFLLLILKELIEIINKNWTFNFLNTFLLIILIFMLISGSYSLISLIKDVNNAKCQKIKIISKNNTTDQHFLGYFSLFVLFAISFDIQMYSMAIVFLMVLVMIGIVYIKNDMYFINPLLNIFGYSFYDVECMSQSGEVFKIKVFYKGIISENREYFLCTKYSSAYFLKSR